MVCSAVGSLDRAIGDASHDDLKRQLTFENPSDEVLPDGTLLLNSHTRELPALQANQPIYS
jgi:hypothetical protein